MKNLSIPLVLSIVLLPSCKKDLNQVPVSSGTPLTFYKGPGDFQQAVAAAYSNLRNYPDNLLNLSEVRSDNIYPINDVARDADPINNFSPNIAANVSVEGAWSSDFNGIFKANTVLDQINKNGANIGNSTLANRFTAEAKFLRAFYYFDLVRYFGKVPIIDHPVTAVEARNMGRSAVDSASVSATTKAATGDTQAPTTPASRTATAASTRETSGSWGASTDNVG